MVNIHFLNRAPCHGLINYDDAKGTFYIIPFGPTYVDNQYCHGFENLDDAIIEDFNSKNPENIEKYGKSLKK